MEDQEDVERINAIREWERACEEKREFLHAHVVPPGHPQEHTAAEARERFRFLSQQEEETRKRMDDAFLKLIERKWSK